MKPITQADNFKYLTVAIVLLLSGMAFAQQVADASFQRIMQSATVITLLVIVWGVRDKGVDFSKAFIFPIIIVISAFLGFIMDNVGLDYIHLILMLIFFISTSVQTAKQVLFSGEVDGNKILGAICLYMLLGLIWALCFTLIEMVSNHAFNGINENKEWFFLLPEFVYFSFVTLTTLGYGDITPELPMAQFLVYIEAIIGQFYLTVLVASLVGSRISSIQQKHEVDHD